MKIENLAPNITTSVFELLKQGVRIEYPSGIILSGDPENGYIDMYLDTGLGVEKMGLYDLSEKGAVEAYLSLARELAQRGEIDGFQVVDEYNEPVGFESFEILEYSLAVETIENEGGCLLIVRSRDIENPEYVGFDD